MERVFSGRAAKQNKLMVSENEAYDVTPLDFDALDLVEKDVSVVGVLDSATRKIHRATLVKSDMDSLGLRRGSQRTL